VDQVHQQDLYYQFLLSSLEVQPGLLHQIHQQALYYLSLLFYLEDPQDRELLFVPVVQLDQ
jgi:hypothetical protein